MKKILILFLIAFSASVYAQAEQQSKLRIEFGGFGGYGTASSDWSRKVQKDLLVNENYAGGNNTTSGSSYGDGPLSGGKVGDYHRFYRMSTTQSAPLTSAFLQLESDINPIFTGLIGYSTLNANGAKDRFSGLNLSSDPKSGTLGFVSAEDSNNIYNEQNRELYAGSKIKLFDDKFRITLKLISGSQNYSSNISSTEGTMYSPLPGSSLYTSGYTTGSGFGVIKNSMNAEAKGIYPGIDLEYRITQNLSLSVNNSLVSMKGSATSTKLGLSSTFYSGSRSRMDLTSKEFMTAQSDYKVEGIRTNITLKYRVAKYFNLFLGHFREDVNVSYPGYISPLGYSSTDFTVATYGSGASTTKGTLNGYATASGSSSTGFPTTDLLSNALNYGKKDHRTKDYWTFGVSFPINIL